MKKILLTLLCVSDNQLINESMKYAKLNAILGALLIIGSALLYVLEFKPAFDELAQMFESTAEMISAEAENNEFDTASELLQICSEMTRDFAFDLSLALFCIGVFMLFSGLMYYRFHVLYNALNK